MSPEARDGTKLHLELNEDPAAKTFQQALLQQGKPAAMFYVDHRPAERHLRQPDPVDQLDW